MSAAQDLEKGVSHHAANPAGGGDANSSHPDFDKSEGGYRNGGAMMRNITPGGHPVDNSQPALPVYHRKLGNPSPLGLLAFAISTFTLSMYNANFRGVTTPNVIVGLAFAVGGLGEFIAGIQEFIVGNTFGATVFVIYAGFWTSLSMIYMPFLGVIEAYGDDVEGLNNALGLYLVAWCLMTVFFTLTALKSSIPLVGLFVALIITFACLSAAYLVPSTAAAKAGGAFGIISAACGAYAGIAAMLTPDTAYFLLPAGSLAR